MRRRTHCHSESNSAEAVHGNVLQCALFFQLGVVRWAFLGPALCGTDCEHGALYSRVVAHSPEEPFK